MNRDDWMEEAARFLLSEPAAVGRALATHRRRSDGRCAGCGHTQRWPCAPASTAMLAQRMLHPASMASKSQDH